MPFEDKLAELMPYLMAGIAVAAALYALWTLAFGWALDAENESKDP